MLTRSGQCLLTGLASGSGDLAAGRCDVELCLIRKYGTFLTRGVATIGPPSSSPLSAHTWPLGARDARIRCPRWASADLRTREHADRPIQSPGPCHS